MKGSPRRWSPLLDEVRECAVRRDFIGQVRLNEEFGQLLSANRLVPWIVCVTYTRRPSLCGAGVHLGSPDVLATVLEMTPHGLEIPASQGIPTGLFVVYEVTQIRPLTWSFSCAPGRIRTSAHGLGIRILDVWFRALCTFAVRFGRSEHYGAFAPFTAFCAVERKTCTELARLT